MDEVQRISKENNIEAETKLHMLKLFSIKINCMSEYDELTTADIYEELNRWIAEHRAGIEKARQS